VRIKLRIEPRPSTPRWLRILLPLISLLLSFVVGALFLWAAGGDPIDSYVHIAQAGFGSSYALSDTLVKATPLIFCGLGALIAFRTRLWNLGGEGQLLIGAWAAAGVALSARGSTTASASFGLLLMMALAAGVSGAAWAGICGALRVTLGVSELLCSLMLNYIALLFVRYFVFGPWSEGGFPLTAMFPRAAWLPRLSDLSERLPFLQGVTVHLGLPLALFCALGLALLFARSRWGFALRVLGGNPRAALLGGLAVRRDTLLVLLLSGALAGLAGMSEVAGVVHRLSDRFSPGYGFTAVIIAWLAKLEPLAVVPVALLLGGLLVGGKAIQPAGIPEMLQGVLLLSVVGVETLATYRVRIG
jgi:simple sugar transport system permease protein